MTSPSSPAPPPAPLKCFDYDRSNGACSGSVKTSGNLNYCALHHDGQDRVTEFVAAFDQKLQQGQLNFAWVRCPLPIIVENRVIPNEVDFSSAQFTKLILDKVTFSQGVSFKGAVFSDDVTIGSHFIGPVDFTVSEFKASANFVNSRFSGPVTFLGAEFTLEARFNLVVFENDANFSATFRDSVQFSGNQAQPAFSLTHRVAFDSIRLDHPELFNIMNTAVRPWWFINASPTKIKFLDAQWVNDPRDEIAKAADQYGPRGYGRLSKAYRDLAVNSEEEHRYREASDFRYSSMEAQRLAKNNGRAFWTLHWWYWAASGYGERIGRAALFLIGLWLIFGLIYMRAGFARTDVIVPPIATQQVVVQADEVGQPLRPKKALMYSLGVLSLQKPDPKPVTDTATFSVILQSVFGPLQAALLILAIRRKFMR
jgi:uncharacterized protein YjbI with pentapeptide repeats